MPHKHIYYFTILILLGWATLAQAQIQTIRRTITIVQEGKEIGIISFNSNAPIEFSATKINEPEKGTLHLDGNVAISVRDTGKVAFNLVAQSVILKRTELTEEEATSVSNLEEMRDSDQLYRGLGRPLTDEEWELQNKIDKLNSQLLKKIVSKFGWPGFRFAGRIGYEGAFYALQHADLDTQRQMLPLMEQAVSSGDASASDLALLTDRVLVRLGQPQKFGTQLAGTNPPTPQPIEDSDNLDKRRAAVGLQPEAEYLKMFTPLKK